MTSTISSDAASWLALNMVCDNWPAVRGHIARHTATPDDLSRLQHHGVPELERVVPGLRDKLAAVRQGAAFAQECERLEANWAQLVTFADAAYPDLLRWLPDPPPVLYVRGELLPEDQAGHGGGRVAPAEPLRPVDGQTLRRRTGRAWLHGCQRSGAWD